MARIAMVSTACVSVPPRRYGGTELVVSELVKGLTILGHEIVLYSTGDSTAPCALRALYPSGVWPQDPLAELAHAAFAAEDVRRSPRPFDLVHAHVPSMLPLARFLPGLPLVYTIHHTRDPSFTRFYASAPRGIHYVAISGGQARLHPELSPIQVVHHGLDPDLYPFGARGGGYLAFLGRLARDKGPEVAVDVAGACGRELWVGGSFHAVDGPPQWAAFIEEKMASRWVKPLGDVDHARKIEMLAGADALLFPIRWDEPFGLVMVEAMLCGCPVVAFRGGAVEEVVEHGVTGFLADDPEHMARLVREDVPRLDRRAVRARAVERFSTGRMVNDYLDVYRKALGVRRLESAAEEGILHG